MKEDGKTPEENALKKATAGYEKTGMTTFGVDYWFKISGLLKDKQPGPYVRRIFFDKHGMRTDGTDDEVLNYYADIARNMGGKVNGTWTSAIALVISKGKYFVARFHTKTLLVDKRCQAYMPGEPMNSIQIDPVTGKYLAELTKEEWLSRQKHQEKGYFDFMKKHLKDI